MPGQRTLITFDLEHVLAWGAVLMLFAGVAIGFWWMIYEPDRFKSEDGRSLASLTFVLLVVVYCLGYLR